MKEWIDGMLNQNGIENQGMQLVTAKVSGTWNQSSWYQWFGA